MAKKKRTTYMTEGEIVELESQEEPAITCHEDIVRLLRSYRIASKVANAAWKLVEQTEKALEESDEVELARRFIALKNLLHDYAPNNFPAPPEKLRALQELEALYNQWDKRAGDSAMMLEDLFARIMELRGTPLDG